MGEILLQAGRLVSSPLTGLLSRLSQGGPIPEASSTNLPLGRQPGQDLWRRRPVYKALSLHGGGRVGGCWLLRGALYPAARNTFCHSGDWGGGGSEGMALESGGQRSVTKPAWLWFGCPKDDGLYVTTEC